MSKQKRIISIICFIFLLSNVFFVSGIPAYIKNDETDAQKDIEFDIALFYLGTLRDITYKEENNGIYLCQCKFVFVFHWINGQGSSIEFLNTYHKLTIFLDSTDNIAHMYFKGFISERFIFGTQFISIHK